MITHGPYQFTRNPQYCGDILLLAGTAVIFPLPQIVSLSSIAILCFALGPFAEESWLEEVYGEDYLDYKRKAPRFF